MKVESSKGPQCPFCMRTLDPVEYEAFDEDLSELECGWCEHTFSVTYHRRDSWISTDHGEMFRSDKQSDQPIDEKHLPQHQSIDHMAGSMTADILRARDGKGQADG